MTGPASPAGLPMAAVDEDSLEQAAQALESVAGLPLEQHPPAFARFDELLREALESAPPVSSG